MSAIQSPCKAPATSPADHTSTLCPRMLWPCCASFMSCSRQVWSAVEHFLLLCWCTGRLASRPACLPGEVLSFSPCLDRSLEGMPGLLPTRISVQLLVDQLRQKCLEEPRSDDRPRGFSALTQDPKECVLEVRWYTLGCCQSRQTMGKPALAALQDCKVVSRALHLG